jgi:hypothetical protein
MAGTGDGETLLRFELDARADRETRVLRAAAGVVVLIAGVWLFTLPFLVPRAFALAGFVFAVFWLRNAAKQRARGAARHYLELGRDALVLCDGGAEQIAPWSAVESVAIDEDRLVVIVERRNAPVLAIEPHYRGVSLNGLAEHIQQALMAARQRGGCAPAADG